MNEFIPCPFKPQAYEWGTALHLNPALQKDKKTVLQRQHGLPDGFPNDHKPLIGDNDAPCVLN
ncbi:hypothetical protein [Paenibacillus pinistramenti]|uniref:hypothetical protein n=1 Tax=Paenibacillus pinistramenti TaxID=1768003 RepID=UPI001107AC1F|nr:hypothetical protein [Paenibacillus pinistramenti]